MKESIKKIYQAEVDSITPPDFLYKRNRVKPWENILLAAITISAIVILYLPGAYSNPLRTLTISKSVEVRIETNISRVIDSLNYYYTEKRSLYE